MFDILRHEKLYLGPSKMQFFTKELKILRLVINKKGILMDLHKVDKISNWKVPTNKDLLRSFISAVGFLAPNCKGIRISVEHLSGMPNETQPWQWDDTAQQAFNEVKKIVESHQNLQWVALNYAPDTNPIWVTTNGCLTGGSGYVSQGPKPEEARIVGFW